MGNACCRVVIVVFIMLAVNVMVLLFSLQRRSTFETMRVALRRLESELEGGFFSNPKTLL